MRPSQGVDNILIVRPFQYLEWIFTYNISTSSFAKGKEVIDQFINLCNAQGIYCTFMVRHWQIDGST